VAKSQALAAFFPACSTQHRSETDFFSSQFQCSASPAKRNLLGAIIFCLFAAAVISFAAVTAHAAPLPDAAGSALSINTQSSFSKSNQSKVFYHDGKWWAIALLSGDSDWYIWQFEAGTGTWNSVVLVHTSSSRRPDAVLDAANNRLYIFLSNSSKSEIKRYSYSSGAWMLDSGFPVSLSDFLDGGTTNPISMTQAKDGALWVFRMVGNKLEAKKSTNQGSTWSGIITIKTGLNTSTGTADGIAFSNASAENCVGVAYAETNATGSRFGFLMHRDSDADNVWTDETSSLTFTGSEHATNELCVTVDGGNNIYVLTQNANAAGAEPRNTLYQRNPSGSWQSFAVNTSANWKNPAIAVDAVNNVLYALGLNATSGQGEYKSCAIGQEANLSGATATTLFASGTAADDFTDLSVPAPGNFGAAPALMVCADNKDADDIWYNQIAFGGGGGSTPLTVGNPAVSPNEANVNASYTISLTLGSAGALVGGSGTMTIQFPNDTFVPDNIGTSEVTINGTTASTIIANSAAREVTITAPVDLANSDNVTIVLQTGASLLNPSASGNKTLSVRTSAEPSPVASPNYTISSATSSVSSATVTPTPNLTSAAAAYALNFTLGAHGRLLAGSSTITITFNNATTVSGGSIAGAQINGVNANATGNSAGKTVVLTAPASLSLNNGAAVTISLPASALMNPASSGNYTLTAATSVETAPTTSNSYAIALGTSLTVGTISFSTNEANTSFNCTIPLTLGSGGALSAGSGTITVQFPDNTFVPGGIAANQVTVNGASASAVTSNSGTREVIITVPNNLANNASVDLVFNSGAGLLHPSIAGNYAVLAWSSSESAHMASPNYALSSATTTVTAANVTPSPNTVSSAATYTIVFNLGAHGRLLAGSSTITITFNNATTVNNGSISNAQINGVNAAATGNSSNKTITLTIPAALTLNNGAAVTVALPSSATTNPASSGFYTLDVATSVENGNVVSNLYEIGSSAPPPPEGTGTPISGTGGSFDKPHQSRVFYHDGKWWLAALKKSDSKWKLWKFDGANWSEQLQIADSKASRPDCFVDNAANKLYIFISHTSQSKFLRLSYSAGAWSIDSGYPANVPSFTHSSEYSASFSRAKNGELWAFRAPSSSLEGVVSTNEGQTWSGVITLKSGLHNKSLTDCHAFSAGGDYMGVCYSENSTSNSIVGFLRHQDGAGQSTWTDETSQLPLYSGTQSDAHINIAVTQNGTVYLITKTDGGGNTTVDNGLYKRAPGGGWQLFAINRGSGWTRPALGIDESNNRIYAFGTPEGTDKLGYLKIVALGSESQIEDATQYTVFQGGGDSFVNLSTAQHNHTSASGMMVAVQDDAAQQVWYNLLSLGSGGSSPTPLVINSVTVNPNTAASNAAYTLGLSLGSQGSLTGGSGTIQVTWPGDTNIPASMTNANVTVNGSTAAAVATNSALRQATVTVPNNLGNSASVSLAFTAGAGLTNPTAAGNYILQAQTSAQPVNVNSLGYAIAAPPAGSSLIVGNITVTPDTVNRNASYNLPLTLGSSGALAGGSGTITVTWPNGTQVPASISNASITVNGAAAANVTTTPAARQAVVTVPDNLANSANVALLFMSAAGLVNPATAGNFTLQVHTSAEGADISSPAYNIKSEASSSGTHGQVVDALTDAKLEGSNQSKLFYHQANWWLIAFDSVASDWHLWKRSNGVWTKSVRVDDRSAVRIDAVLDSADNRFYFVSAHEKKTKFLRFNFSNGTWAQESKVDVLSFGNGSTNTAISMARAKNGELWLFRINAGALETQISTNNGQTWSATMVLKSGITGAQGNTRALTFTANGNRTGVFYGMSAGAGGVDYGFLHHLDGDATTAWADESANLTFFGAEHGDSFIHAQAANDGRLFLLTQNSNASGASAVGNTLYSRSTGGSWSKHKVNVGASWTSPVVGIDESNDQVYLAGIRAAAPNFAEYKSCSFGNEAALETQSATALLQNGNDVFGELTAPGHFVYASAGLLLCGGNTTRNDAWSNLINLGVGKHSAWEDPQQKIAGQNEPRVSVYPNPFNPATTIRFRVTEASSVRLHIFNIRGELVRTLWDQETSAGMHERRWNGRDRDGQIVASGVYFYRLEIGAQLYRGRLEMVK